MADKKGNKKDDKKVDKNQEKVPGSKLNVIIVALLVVIIFGMLGMGAGYYLLVVKGTKTSTSAVEKTAVAEAVAENTYTLDEFTINLADTDAQKYINAQISLGYDESLSKLKSELESTETVKKPILSDAAISVIRSKKAADFQGAGLEKIKQEIIDAVNPNLSKGKILHVYFSKLVIQ